MHLYNKKSENKLQKKKCYSGCQHKKIKDFRYIFCDLTGCFIIFGYILNSFGIKAGLPLYIYEKGDIPIDGYSSLATKDDLTLFIFLILGIITFVMITTCIGKLSPFLYSLCCTS
ncbi:DUF6688 domain-containing protein [Heyndrickxia sporothermodurans]